ncbi:hypothetical protein [Deinococcus knuensis]|uniref:Low temperature-induced protein n=1 Tax=Deinococcus knuensis TaxID=1837380 RepID=A0ABQ2SFN4_9DEIO|nr:hypothetical protein [Deinococcus knuensis]GGS26941.1 hypothetical protein GCM10008961_18080 [Deinococcus knuensis]
MKHIIFPTETAADAFIADLKSQGVIAPTMGSATVTRRGAAADPVVTDGVDGGTAEDAGAGAVKGTGVGAAVGAVAGILATGATIATGGLALPVVLGMAALGSGVGAAVGATGGAMGVDETGHTYEADDDYYDRLNTTTTNGGRVVAVDESVPTDVVEAAAIRHGGEYSDGGTLSRRTM